VEWDIEVESLQYSRVEEVSSLGFQCMGCFVDKFI
jgi:hypothetical protein